MAKYRKKPVVIEAEPVSILLNFASRNWSALPEWVKESYEKGNIVFLNNCLSIMTLEGRMKAGFEDYLIKGVNGEIYPCKPDIFSKTYEIVDETN